MAIRISQHRHDAPALRLLFVFLCLCSMVFFVGTSFLDGNDMMHGVEHSMQEWFDAPPSDTRNLSQQKEREKQVSPSHEQTGLLSKFDGNSHNQTSTSQKQPTTLALLYPPGMIGGYRNQVMRFIGLCDIARKQHLQLLLGPSLLWSTTYPRAENDRDFFPIPMHEIFDIDHWNDYVTQHNRRHPNDNEHEHRLPWIVASLDTTERPADCWSATNTRDEEEDETRQFFLNAKHKNGSSFVTPWATKVMEESALIPPTYEVTRLWLQRKLKVNPRKIDYLPLVENCTHPVVHGGGTGAGRLWDQYLYFMPQLDPKLSGEVPPPNHHRRRKPKTPQQLAAEQVTKQTNTWFAANLSQALTPSKEWRKVADECIEHGQGLNEQQNEASSRTPLPYVALHARVEVDMLIHKCGADMEKNLTTIFAMVDDMIHTVNHQEGQRQLHGVFVAVSRQGMEAPNLLGGPMDRTILDHNVAALNRRMVAHHLQKGRDEEASTFAFECGEVWMEKWYNAGQHQAESMLHHKNYYGSLLPSVLNFYIATQASVFVGVARSSWSTDVWTHRYHQGKGATNWMYTPEGLRPVPNGGLPPTHSNCQGNGDFTMKQANWTAPNYAFVV